MRLFNKKALVLLLTTALFSHIMANNSGIIYDCLNKKHFRYKSLYFELKNSKINFYDELTFHIPVIEELKDSLLQKKLNRRFKHLLKDQVNSDSFKTLINTHCMASVKAYIKNEVNDYLGEFRENLNRFTPELQDIKFRFLSYFNDIVVFQAIFQYKAQYQRLKIENLEYIQTYYFSFKTGQEYPKESVLNTSKTKEINLFIEQKAKLFFDKYKLIAIPDNDNENYYHQSYLESKQKKPELSEFTVTDNGFIYPKVFSFAYYISSEESCLKNVDGNDLELRLSLDEIKPFLNPNGPYGFLMSYQLEQSPKKIAFQKPRYLNELKQNYFINPITIAFDNEIPLQLKPGIRKVVLSSRYAYQDSFTKNQDFEYNEKGYLVTKNTYIGQKISNQLALSYNEKNQIVKQMNFENKRLLEATDYTYDKQGNLVQVDFSQDLEFDYSEYLFNIGNQCFIEKYTLSDGKIDNQCIRKSYTDSGILLDYMINNSEYNSSNYYTYDSSKRLIAVQSNVKIEYPYTGRYRFFTYNQAGQLISSETEDDITYYTYNAQNQLIKEMLIYRDNVVKTRNLTYNEKGEVEQIELKSENQSSPRFTQLTYYYW